MIFNYIIFLLITWEFHIMYPNQTYFLVLQDLPRPRPVNLFPQKRRRKKFNLCCPYVPGSMVKLPVSG